MAPLRNKRHEHFCRAVASGADPSEAIVAAGYHPKPENARTVVWQINKRQDITDRIAELMAEAGKRSDVKADRVIRELARIAFLDPRAVLSWQKLPTEVLQLKDSADMSADAAAAIAEISQTAQGVRVKFHNKLPALEMLGRYLQLWQENQNARGIPYAITDKPQTTEEWLETFTTTLSGKTQH